VIALEHVVATAFCTATFGDPALRVIEVGESANVGTQTKAARAARIFLIAVLL
jgi:hypothetical protein